MNNSQITGNDDNAKTTKHTSRDDGGVGTTVNSQIIHWEHIYTPSGKQLPDFDVPEKFLTEETELVKLIMESEALKDSERQYWFNLSDIMDTDQIEKLRDIFVKEKDKIAAINEKYGIAHETSSQKQHRIAEKNRHMQIKKEELQKKENLVAQEERQQEDMLLQELEGL